MVRSATDNIVHGWYKTVYQVYITNFWDGIKNKLRYCTPNQSTHKMVKRCGGSAEHNILEAKYQHTITFPKNTAAFPDKRETPRDKYHTPALYPARFSRKRLYVEV